MDLLLKRTDFTKKSTISDFSINDEWFSYLLEDVDRGLDSAIPATLNNKVDKQTAIPYGRYRLILDMSARFGKIMPHILDVPGFQGIRMHNGNTDVDTDGCPLFGSTKSFDFVGHSVDTFKKFMAVIEPVFASGEEIWITVTK